MIGCSDNSIVNLCLPNALRLTNFSKQKISLAKYDNDQQKMLMFGTKTVNILQQYLFKLCKFRFLTGSFE